MIQLISRAMMVSLGFSLDAVGEIFNWQEIDLIDKWLDLENDNVKTLPGMSKIWWCQTG